MSGLPICAKVDIVTNNGSLSARMTRDGGGAASLTKDQEVTMVCEDLKYSGAHGSSGSECKVVNAGGITAGLTDKLRRWQFYGFVGDVVFGTAKGIAEDLQVVASVAKAMSEDAAIKADSSSQIANETKEQKEMSVKKLNETGEVLEQFRNNKDKEMVVWVEPPEERKKEQFLKIFMQPMYPEKIIEEKLRPKLENMILTSATLSSGKKDFKFFKNKIVNIEAGELILASPFDYAKNCLIYLPKNVRDPATEPDEYHEDISKLIPMLLALTEGNAFVLFTSFKSLQTVYDAIVDTSDYPIFSQKEMGAEKAKAEFLTTDNSVLFGVSTFWQGIDIKGDKLKSVIITKLPFQPPNEPVLEARMEEIKKKNGNPFGEMQLPQAILTLKQGFGRLIRSKTDKGVVSILDPRLQTKNYGKQILDALPPAKKVYSLKDLKIEYKKIHAETNSK